MPERGLLEPSSTFDRLVYLGLAITGPRTAIFCFRTGREDMEMAGLCAVVASVIATYYTVVWAITSLRRLNSKR